MQFERIREPTPHSLPREKPRLLIEDCAPDRTVAALRDILAAAGGVYDRGLPVRLAFDQLQQSTVVQEITPDALVLAAHALCRPYVLKTKQNGAVYEADARLPRSMSIMYLAWRGEWQLPPLNGIATAPLLRDDGAINSSEGYDPVSGMWCENMPNLGELVPDRPTKDAAAAALSLIRRTFRTFCFADAQMIDSGGVPVVDLTKPPGSDESSLLVALLTAVCRPSLQPRTRGSVASGADIGCRRRQRTACALHKYHRIRSRATCRDRGRQC
jgi:hypothetical protein